MSHNLLSPPSNPGVRAAVVSTKPVSRDVLCILIIEGTESMADHFKNMYQSFLNPFLAQLRLPVPLEVDGQKTKITPSLKIGVVIYGDYLPKSSTPLTRHYFTSDFQVFQDNIAAVRFEKGGPCFSAVGEGLCAALEMFDRYQDNVKTPKLVDPIRHCVLVGNSLPYSSSTSLNLKEEYDDLPLPSICGKLKEYRVNFSMISTDKLLDSLHSIPSMVNTEDICVLDYCRAGLTNYVARMAGVLPNESFKGPGWLRITSIKDNRRIRDFDPAVLAEMKKVNTDLPKASPANIISQERLTESIAPAPKEMSTPKNSIGTPFLVARAMNGTEARPPSGGFFSAPNTVQASPATQPLELQEISSPNKRKYNKIQETISATESPKPLEGTVMQRQTSNKSAKGSAKKQPGPKKITKAQLKAQAKANASANFNSPDSATPIQLAGPESNPSSLNQHEGTDLSRVVSEQSTPLFSNSRLPNQLPNGPDFQSPQSIKSPPTPASAFLSNPGTAWASPSPNVQVPGLANNSNFSTPNGMFQSPSIRPGAMMQHNTSSLAVPSPVHMSNSPNKDHSPGTSGLNPGHTQQTPISTPSPDVSKLVQSNAPPPNPNSNLLNADSRIWSGEITFKLTNVSINEDAIGGVTIQPMAQSGLTIDDYMLDKWPQRLQISSFMPCNVTALMDHAKTTMTPAFILHPESIGDSPKNLKVYSAILTKLPEKQGILVVDFNLGENNTHGIYLFKAHQRVLGLVFVKSPFPNLELFSLPPEAMNPGMMRPSVTPQQFAALKQQQQQALGGAMMNPGMNMNMNMNMNMSSQMNPMAMGMFGMNMMNPNMYLANQAMMNPNFQGMLGLEAMRRGQLNNPQFLSPNSGLQQQIQQMQAQGMQLHPQQIQQLQQMRQQQMSRPQNHPQ